ncbi:hypothetical protein Sjap_020994 [Stephania japonica]|uniref:Uncharacterized protein n=1 Tax=Stephania japonica TaxID=461633 RepID=A0AAP0I0V6_9MAGN
MIDAEKDAAGIRRLPSNNLVFSEDRSRDEYDYLEIGVYNGDHLSYSGMTKKGEIRIWILDESRKVNLTRIVRENWDDLSSLREAMEIKN